MHTDASVTASMRMHPQDEDVAANEIVVDEVEAVNVYEPAGHRRFHVLESPWEMVLTTLPLTDTVAVDDVPPVAHDE